MAKRELSGKSEDVVEAFTDAAMHWGYESEQAGQNEDSRLLFEETLEDLRRHIIGLEEKIDRLKAGKEA